MSLIFQHIHQGSPYICASAGVYHPTIVMDDTLVSSNICCCDIIICNNSTVFKMLHKRNICNLHIIMIIVIYLLKVKTKVKHKMQYNVTLTTKLPVNISP